jgi:hypothetical protein
LPEPVRKAIEPELREMGELAATTLFELSMRGRRDEPQLVPYDPWGRRIDEIRVPEAWRAFARVAAEWGLVAIPHERKHGRFPASTRAPWSTSSGHRPPSTPAPSP